MLRRITIQQKPHTSARAMAAAAARITPPYFTAVCECGEAKPRIFTAPLQGWGSGVGLRRAPQLARQLTLCGAPCPRVCLFARDRAHRASTCELSAPASASRLWPPHKRNEPPRCCRVPALGRANSFGVLSGGDGKGVPKTRKIRHSTTLTSFGGSGRPACLLEMHAIPEKSRVWGKPL